MSNITIDGKQYGLVQKKEEVNYEIHAHEVPGSFPNFLGGYESLALNVYLMDLTMRRNFIDDTFTLSWPKFASSVSTTFELHNTLSANNAVTVGIGSGVMERTDWIKRYFDARSFSLKNAKFRDSTSWTRAYIDGKDSFNLSVFPHFSSFSQQALLNENQALEIDLIHDSHFFLKDMESSRSENPSSYIGQKNYYSHFYIVPTEASQLTHQVKIADIYRCDDDDQGEDYYSIGAEDYKHEFDFSSVSKYTSTSFSGTMGVSISDENEKVNNVVIDGLTTQPKDIYKLGSINLIDSTYYDYDTGKTMVGFGNEDEVGEIIPYSFYGSYTRSFDLGLIDFLKHFKIDITKNIAQKVLDPYSGMVVLNIDESNDFTNKGEMNDLSGRQLQSLRDVLVQGKFIPLSGIRRFSDE